MSSAVPTSSAAAGRVLGICLGVALILTVDSLLILLRAPGVYLQGFVGAIVILAVIVNAWFARRVGGQSG